MESFSESKSKWNLTRDLDSFGLVDLTFLTSSLTALSKGRERRDKIVVEDIKRRIVVLRVSEEDVHYKVTIMGVLFSFDVDKPLKVFVVDDKVPRITI